MIDAASQTLYVVGLIPSGSSFLQHLHALDLSTGAEKFGGPVSITAKGFEGLHENQRPALALSKGTLYIGFSSHCDEGTYHGYVFSYDAATLAQQHVFNVTPTATMGSIWQSGQGPAIDSSGNLYVVTSNGSFDGVSNFSNSFLKLSPTLDLLDWFTPTNWSTLNSKDLDLNSSGPLLIPGTHLVLGAGKQGIGYVINTAAMGHLGDSHAVQHFQFTSGEVKTSAVSWDSSAKGQVIYTWGIGDHLKAYKFNGSQLATTPFMQSSASSANPGGILSLSSNGGSEGIVWANASGIVRAYDADKLSSELWNSSENRARDDCNNTSKNAPPTIANGRVYLASFGTGSSGSGQLCVYGLLNTSQDFTLSVTPSSINAAPGTAATYAITVGAVNGFNGLVTFDVTGLPSGATASFSSPTINAPGSSRLTVTTAGVATGSFPLAISGTSGTLNHEVNVTLLVSATAILAPVADSYVRDGTSANTNFGKAAVLQIKTNPQIGLNRHVLLRFDLSGVSTIGSAKLRLFGSLSASSGRSPVVAHAVTDNWSEANITWNNQPAAGAALSTSSIGTAAQYQEWDVTAYLQSQKASGAVSVSIELKNDVTTPDPVSVNSREATANVPQLVITP